MALIVEDGTGLTTANSYVSLSVADSYHLLRKNAAWIGPDTEKEVRTLTVTAACSADGDLTITLDGTSFTVAVITALDTAAKVAAVVRAASFTGWVVTGADDAAILTADTAETRDGTYTLGVAATGVTGAIVQTQTGSDNSKESALIRATFALDGMYGRKWPGYKASSAQALDWPRQEAYDVDGYALGGLPNAIALATCEAALVELTTARALTPELDRGGTIVREKVGPLETQYASGASSYTTYAAINNCLIRIVPGGAGSMKFSRG